MKVLIVDDNPDNVELVVQVLEDKYETLTASNGAECLAIAQRDEPDLVLLDVMMPGMDGYEVLRLMQLDERTKDIPVIFLTARYKDIDRIVKGLSLGAFDYITKPFEDDILQARVGVAMRVKKAEDSLREKNKKLLSYQSSLELFGRQISRYGEAGLISEIKFGELDEDVMAMASVFHDAVTRRQKAESALSEREKEFEHVLANMLNAVICISNKGIISRFNKTAEEMFGYQSDEVIGRNINMLMTQADASNHDGYLNRFVSGAGARIIGEGREIKGRRKNGETFPMHISIAELEENEFEERRFIGSCIDMTVQQRQEEHIRRVQKMDALGNLVGGVTHDYNNMLGVISGFAELLAQGDTAPDDVVKFAEQIGHSAKRGVSLTRKLLNMSRYKQTENNNCNLVRLLDDMNYVLETTLSSSIQLELLQDSELWDVWLDVGDLEDCILNMAINARHAMEDGGTLTIETRNLVLDTEAASTIDVSPGEYILLRIADTGEGIPDDALNKVFDPFFSTKGQKGTGLGLSQVYGFVQRSGGGITVNSELGKGSEFSVFLPRSTVEKTLVEESAKEEDNSARGQGETILFIDDEPSYRRLMEAALNERGFTVLCAANREDAENILSTETVDLIISDVMMPEMNGYQLAEVLHEIDPDVPIQLLSGYSDIKGTTRLGKRLQSRLLRKPISTEALIRRIHELIDSRVIL